MILLPELPMWVGGMRSGDAQEVHIDRSVDWTSVGGLEEGLEACIVGLFSPMDTLHSLHLSFWRV